VFGPVYMSCRTGAAADFLIFSLAEFHAAMPTPSKFPYNSANDVGNTTGTGVGVGVGATVGVGKDVGVGVASGVGVTTGTGFAIATPLFHTNFLPLLMHVYFLPLAVAVVPAIEQAVPALTTANALSGNRKRAITSRTPKALFMQ